MEAQMQLWVKTEKLAIDDDVIDVIFKDSVSEDDMECHPLLGCDKENIPMNIHDPLTTRFQLYQRAFS